MAIKVEEWRDVKDYEGLYEVSSCGLIRSLPRNGTSKNGRVLKPGIIYNGYRQVVLGRYGEKSSKLVHRLVAQAFIENPKNKPAVNHKDGNPGNNSVENLEWVSHEENIMHKSNGFVHCVIYCVETQESYCSYKEASAKTGVSRTAIGNCVSGLSRTAGGYHWLKLNKGENL